MGLPLNIVIATAATSGVLLLLLITAVVLCRRKGRSGLKKGGGLEGGEGACVGNSTPLGHSCIDKVKSEREDLNMSKKSTFRNMKLGRINYSLDCHFQENKVTLSVIECKDLQATDTYVTASLPPDTTKHQSKTIHHSTCPFFNQNFCIEISYEELTQRTLVLAIHDGSSKDLKLGEVVLRLSEVNLTEVVERWDYWQPPDDTVVRLMEVTQQELCFSLEYAPTSGKLTVVVLEARNLKKIGKIDPYVKIWLMNDEKRLMKKKTTVKKATQQPYYAESFILQVPFSQMKTTHLVFSVLHYDCIGKSQLIGTVTIGCTSKGSQLEQWSSMLANPRKLITKWQQLKTP